MEKYRFIAVVLTGICILLFIIMHGNDEVHTVSMVSKSKKVAITFDDGPHYIRTQKLLDGLSERGVKATFFLVGNRVSGNEDLVLRMKEEGHLVGNHSYSHADLTRGSMEEAIYEISETNKVIEKITGEKVKYLRPPCGYWNDEIEKNVDMVPVLWDVDPLDWRTDDPGEVVNRVLTNVDDGDIILFHDIYESSVVAALEVIDRLMERGYVFVTVDELLE